MAERRPVMLCVYDQTMLASPQGLPEFAEWVEGDGKL